MLEDKTYSILFILDNHIGEERLKLAQICMDFIKAGHEVHVIYSSIDIDEALELSLSKVPWIHIYKLPISANFNLSQLFLPVSIRKYINRNDGVDIIHSFGLNCGILAYLSVRGLKTKVINTPGAININNDNIKAANLLKRFVFDNITYIFNRLYGTIVFFSSFEKNKSTEHVSYKNINSNLVDIAENSASLSERLMQTYDK